MRTRVEGSYIRPSFWNGSPESGYCARPSRRLFLRAVTRVHKIDIDGGVGAKYKWFARILATFVVIAAVALQDGAITCAFLAVGRFLGIRQGLGQEKRQAVTSRLGEELIPLESALHSLAVITESRDRELGGHSERVAENSVTLGRECGLGDSQLEELWWAGLLHDVGKIGLAESILHKAGPLTDSERREVRKHPEFGAEIVFPFAKGFPAITDAIRYHHERWDGLGYPAGLTGEEIPLYARIVAIADVFEALTSSRPYRTALTAEQARTYVARESGTHFDPSMVRVFDVVYRSNGLHIAESVDPYPSIGSRSVSSLLATRVG